MLINITGNFLRSSIKLNRTLKPRYFNKENIKTFIYSISKNPSSSKTYWIDFVYFLFENSKLSLKIFNTLCLIIFSKDEESFI